jgi:hypothetical protein
MAKYLSQLNRKLQVGISSYTDNSTVLNVIGNVGIKTDIARADFDVDGNAIVSGILSVETQMSAADVFVTGVSTFRGKIAVGATILNPEKDLDVAGPSLFRDDVSVASSVTAGEYNGPLRFGDPQGGFKPGAIEIERTDFTKNSINDINFILGKLVPKPPKTILNVPFTILNLGVGYLCSGFSSVNNTFGVFSVSAGTQYPRNTTNNITSDWITEYGPGDQGTVSAMVNFTSLGSREMISNDKFLPDNSIVNDFFSDSGIYDALEIANDKDAFFSSRNTGIASDFYEVYDARILNASLYPKGFNMAYIKHQVDTDIFETEKYLWYEDPSTVSPPSLISSTPITPPSPTLNYSSGIPHYTESTNNNFEYNITCLNATGDMYSNYTFLTSSGQTTGFQNDGNKNYVDFGGVNPPARNFGVGAGVTCTVLQRPRNLHITVTSSTQKFSLYTATTPYGSDVVRATIPQIVNIMGTTARTDVIDEDNILIQTLGTGSGNAKRVNAGSSGDNPIPVYSSWSASTSVATYEATVVGGDLKHDQTNYSTGYLPVGPNYSSGRSGSQYFQLELIRSNVSEFRIVINGSYSGCWVSMPNNSAWTTSLSGTNGWADMFKAYKGSGIPTTLLPGCAFAGNMTGSSGSFTCVFGTESSSNDLNNRILVRFKLNAGNQINTLSFTNT